MKKLLISLALAFGLVGMALAQVPSPVPFTALPGAGDQAIFYTVSGKPVPVSIVPSQNGLTYLVFDPSVAAADYSAALQFLQSAQAYNLTGGVKLTGLVAGGFVNTAINVQETRVAVPFSVTASTTLQTIPFSQPITLQTNAHYRFVANLYVVTGTGGSKIDVGGTCNTSNFLGEYQCFAATTLLYGGQITSFLSGPGGSSTGTATKITIDGELDVTNGGTFVIQFAQNGSNATASTVLAGSTLTVTQIP